MRCFLTILFVAMLLSPASAQVEFDIVQSFDLTSTTPWLYGDYLQLVDLTGDDIPDLLTIDSGNLVSYELQGGQFVEIATTPLLGSGTLAAVADLNNDGPVDALVRLTNGYVSMLGDGAGGFTEAGSYLTPWDIGQVLVGDFNDDGLLDAAAARDTGGAFPGVSETEIGIRLGDGSGSFGLLLESNVPQGLNYAVVIDLDENGTDDLLLSGVAQLTFAFLSDGVVTNYVNYPAGAGDAPQDIRVADLNDDGHLDVVFTCPLMGLVGVLIQDGSGVIGSFQDYEVDGAPVTVRPEDVNDDAIPDLLTTTNSGFEWRLGLGDGSFGDSTVMPMSMNSARFAVGDSTSDGLAEVAVLSGSTVSILLNTTPVSPQADEFIRGDVDLDGQVAFADPIRALEALFVLGSPPIECPDTADANDDGSVNLVDGVYLLNYLFGPISVPPPAPGVNDCGVDPTADSLADCGVIDSCL